MFLRTQGKLYLRVYRIIRLRFLHLPMSIEKRNLLRLSRLVPEDHTAKPRQKKALLRKAVATPRLTSLRQDCRQRLQLVTLEIYQTNRPFPHILRKNSSWYEKFSICKIERKGGCGQQHELLCHLVTSQALRGASRCIDGWEGWSAEGHSEVEVT